MIAVSGSISVCQMDIDDTIVLVSPQASNDYVAMYWTYNLSPNYNVEPLS